MPTYAVTCSQCGEDRWPTLRERPTAYICARCTAVGPEETARRKEKGARAQQTRKDREASQGTSGDSTGAS